MRWTIGGVRVTKVVEHELTVPFDRLLADPPPDPAGGHPWLAPHFVTGDGAARTSIHGLVIDTGARRVLVDTCIGDMRETAAMPGMPSAFPRALEAAGYALDDIDTVVCTHLHFDHVGWNTRLVDGEWTVTFPRARYLFARREWEHWQENASDVVDLTDTVRPVVAAGQADLVDMDHVLCEEVRLEPTPGHTPGHVSVRIDSEGERAYITGDLAHHPVQFAEPHLCSTADSDRAGSEATRRRFRSARLEDGALVIGTHFPGPTAGRIVARGDEWEFAVE
jgi:glyoxylase-like metal-dependent hydrolase (beta-lactamase superfamily II)